MKPITTTLLLLAAALIAVATIADEPRDDAVGDALRDAVLEDELRSMREAGVTGVPVDSLPAGMADALGLAPGTTIPIERFLDPAFQDAMLEHGAVETMPETAPRGVSPDVLASPGVLEAIRREHPNAVVMDDPAVLQAFRDHEDDDDALRAALEEAIGNLPDEQRKALEDGFQLPGDVGHRPDSMPFERLPTEDVLAKLDPAERDLLYTYRDLLDDHWSLMDAMPSMDKDERAAASKFISRMPQTTVPVFSEYDKAAERWRQQGYRDVADAPRGTVLLATVDQAKRLAREDDGTGLPSAYATAPEFVSGTLPYVPDEYVMPDSKSHVLSGVDHATRLYSKSKFGGALLMVEQTRADEFFPREPNLTIAGRPGNVLWTLHGNGVWTTTVAGFDGRNVHHVTVETKLEGSERDEFVRFATGIVEAASLTR